MVQYSLLIFVYIYYRMITLTVIKDYSTYVKYKLSLISYEIETVLKVVFDKK